MWRYNYGPELAHYGVKGMKWGVRRYQNENGTLTSVGKKRYSDDDKNYEQKKGLSSNQKKAIAVGVTTAATVLAAYGAYKLGAFDKLRDTGKKYAKGILENPIDLNSGLKMKKDRSSSIFEDIKNVNPTKSNTNCRACSIATILRMRGFDVEARGDIQGGSLSSAIEKCFKNGKVLEMYSPNKDKVINAIAKRFGEGSSGVMSAEFNLPTGKFQHAFSWFVKDGIVSFIDAQKGLSDFSQYLNYISPEGSVEFARLDNLDIDPNGVIDFVKNR